MPNFRNFQSLSIGDIVSLAESVDDGMEEYVFAISAMDYYRDNSTIRAISNSEGVIHFEEDNYDVKVLKYAKFMPNSDYVVWMDDNHDRHFAFRDGHPANNVWVYNNKRYSAVDIANKIGTHKMYVLERQDL